MTFTVEEKRLNLHINFPKGSRCACPVCGAAQKIPSLSPGLTGYKLFPTPLTTDCDCRSNLSKTCAGNHVGQVECSDYGPSPFWVGKGECCEAVMP
jgi:hypothetical protein